LAQRTVADQQIVLFPDFPDLEHRRPGPEERPHVIDRPQFRARGAERNHRRRMAVHHRHHFRPRAVDLAVDVALEKALALVARQWLAVGVELHQVGGGDQRGRERARHDEMVGALVAARADVTVGIEHFVLREDAARGDQVVDQGAAGGDFLHLCLSCLSSEDPQYSATAAAIAAPANASEAPRTPIASDSGPASSAPSEISAGLSISRLEMRPRIASGADICTIAILLEACAISAAPPITLSAMASAKDGVSATPMMAPAITTIHTDWIRPWRSARPSAWAIKPPSVPPTPTAVSSSPSPVGPTANWSLA